MYSVYKIPYWPFVPVGWLTWSSRRAGRRWPRSQVLMIACPEIQERRCITTSEEWLKTGFVQRNSSWWISGFSALKTLSKKNKVYICYPVLFWYNGSEFWFAQLDNSQALCILLPNYQPNVTPHDEEEGLSQGISTCSLLARGCPQKCLVQQMQGCWWRVCALYSVKRKLLMLKGGA